MSELSLFDWVLWLSLAIGVGVSGLVYKLGVRIPFGQRRRKKAHEEEDLPWEALLDVLKARYKGKSAEDETLSSDELLDVLLADLPNNGAITPEEGMWEAAGERRRARRRWANPVEVTVISPYHAQPLHGLVINRSIGGLAILIDVEIPADTVLAVRAVEAPLGRGFADVTVRHARQVSNLWIIGCQYNGDIPWNVQVWFG